MNKEYIRLEEIIGRSARTFVSACGWKAVREKGILWYNLYNPQGELVREEVDVSFRGQGSPFMQLQAWNEDKGEMEDVIEGKRFQVRTWETRTGRSGKTSHDIRFGIGHFPVGTKFKAGSRLPSDKRPEILTVKKISQNGSQSFVLECEESNDSKIFSDNIGMNIVHVTEIVSRGTGPLVFEGYNDTPLEELEDSLIETSNKENERLSTLSEILERIEERERLKKFLSQRKSSEVYFSRNIHKHLLTMIKQLGIVLPYGAYFQPERILKAAIAAGVIRINVFDDFSIFIYSAKKKKLKSFLRRNYNRFLANLRKEDRLEVEEMNRAMADLYEE